MSQESINSTHAGVLDHASSESNLINNNNNNNSRMNSNSNSNSGWGRVEREVRRLFTVKTLAECHAEEEGGHQLRRTLGPLDLVFLGVGGIIGTGIFVLTGQAAATTAGPAIVVSFVIAGTAAGLAALCYSEMASMIPIAGSAYTYAYATMGELVAWIIGWDLVLEYLVGAAAVSVGWSGYVVSLLADAFGLRADPRWTQPPFDIHPDSGLLYATGNYCNLPAVAITLAMSAMLSVGVKESARANAAMVCVKVIVILMFLFAAIGHVNSDNWKPFVPENTGTFGQFGVSGIFQGATLVFFAYIGFDSVSTTAQECKNPQRDLPIGILASLSICTVLYILTAMVLTGIVPYTELAVPHPIALAVERIGIKWLAIVVEIGAIAGLTSVMLVNLMAQPRILYSMGRDGLLPPLFHKIHPRFETPVFSTIFTGSICAILGGIMPIHILSELTSIGTLFAFVLVSIGVMILRLKSPHAYRRFKVPFGPFWIPLLGAASSLGLICTATPSTLIRLAVWMAIGVVIYGVYGRKHSVANHRKGQDKEVSESAESMVMEQVYETKL